MGRLSSPRFRRRLAWTAGLAAVAAGVVAAVLALPEGVPPPDTPLRPGGDTVAAVPKPLRVTPAMRRRIDVLVRRFVDTTVTRRDPAAGWALASASMHAGVTRAQWNHGDLPVFPYSASALRATSWSVSYAYDDTVGLEVLLQPKEGSGERRLIYAAALVLWNGGFLVDSFYPLQTVGTASAAPGKARRGAGAEQNAHPGQGKLSGTWLLLPVAILSLLLLAPVVLVGRAVVRNRRAARRYRGHYGA